MYHARDVAVMRAQLQNVPVVLATATPAIETRVQVERGRYAHLELPSRYGGAELPTIEAVDMRRFPPPPGRWLSPPLVRALEATLGRGDQALLFLNRRGHAPLTSCRTFRRTEASRGGTECFSTCGSQWTTEPEKKKLKKT